MSVTRLPSPGAAPLDTPEQLCELLQIPFSEQQLSAITAPLEPGVIIAGAGSGKTTVMAARVVWLVGTGQVRPEQVLGLTFTRKAAAELSQRVRSAIARAGVVDTTAVDESGEQLIMTYDAFAARLVADHGLRVGVESDPRMVTGAMRYRLATRVVATAAGPFEQLSRLRPMSVTDRVLRLDSEMQQHLVTSEDLDRHARLFDNELAAAPTTKAGRPYAAIREARQRLAERLELASLAEDYAALKRRLGVVEFADQMAVAAELARTVPEVSRSLRETYRVVLLDEYQDTSSAQAAMLQGLFSGHTVDAGRGHPVTAVGDPFQAIYGWRGAAASNITEFATDFPSAAGEPARAFALTVNRRSGHSILDVANDLAAPLRAVTPTGGNDEEELDTRLVAPPEAGPGQVHGATFTTWPEEVSWICDRIVELGPAAGNRAWSDIAVLTRRNADIAQLYSELTTRDVPAEIVGLGGLLELPEIQDVVATLRLVDDVTANPDVVRLLAGPRWAIGPDDLAQLGRRARDLTSVEPSPTSVEPVETMASTGSTDVASTGSTDVASTGSTDVASTSSTDGGLIDDLAEAVADIDPTELISLLDAIGDPGPGPYTDRAREVFAEFGAELRELRRHADEPVLDLVRRVITTLGIDIELAATPELWRTHRGAQLSTFVDAVAGYVDVDSDASLTGLLGWLQAEQDSGTGLEQAVPSEDDSVKLLTIHKAKGLEWDVVFLPALVEATFPSDRVTDNWVRNAAVVPSPLRGDADAIPQVGHPVSTDALTRFADALKREHRLAEDRLAYVAVTRAKQQVWATGHRWRPDTQRARALSDYLITIIAAAQLQGGVETLAPDDPGDANPLFTEATPVAWPQPLDPDARERRDQAAAWVTDARKANSADGSAPDAELLLDDWARVEGWDLTADRLLDEARRARQPQLEVPLPAVMSASAWLRATTDPDGYAEELLRPMPHRPSQAARFGTRFHRWVEQHFGATALIDEHDLDSADDEEWTDQDLAGLCQSFAEGRFGERQPYRLEAPFEYRLAGRVIRGRIDAVYREGDQWLVIDWKTSAHTRADPLQLAIYRLAWAELQGVGAEAVRAGFFYVRRDELDIINDLPTAEALADRLYGTDTAD